ncbi:MAG: M14 family zinc carboxypeptidase [Victivallales bacterium]|nr:M14 family zinc carboxypeptidase [Victivallales bacterium]
MRFERYEIRGLVPRPAWWQVRTDGLEKLPDIIKKGRVEIIARTPGGFPVNAFFYNCTELSASGVNWSAAASSGNPEKFKSSGYDQQTVVICAGIHGAEAEGIAAAVNIISLLESGADLRGRANAELANLLNQYRLIIIPCVNMDGRSISPDHLRGASFAAFRKASQGTWKDGRLIDWRGSKEYFPLPLDEVEFPGGYPNGTGYNINHDCAPGNIRTAEAAAVLKLVEAQQADLFLNLHSHEEMPVLLMPGSFNYRMHIERGRELRSQVFREMVKKGQIPDGTLPEGCSQTINLDTAVTMSSGALTLTFESPVTDKWTFDQLLEIHYTLFKTILKNGLERLYAPRKKIIELNFNS